MNHSFRATAICLLGAFVLATSSSVFAQNADPVFFNAQTLTKILDQRDCEGIRFYNIMKPDSREITTMAIGIRADGSEISNLTNRYYVFMGANATELSYDKLNQSKAAEACQKVKDAGATSFSASFTKSQVVDMLEASSMNGIIVQQKQVEEMTTYEVQAGTNEAGQFVPLMESQAIRNTEPCPTFCGASRNYVNM